MKNLKLAVSCAFVVGFGAFALWTSGTVKGQSGSSLSAPTGVIASDSVYHNKVSISWDTIRGATSYRIFRNTTNDLGTAVEIGTTVAGLFLDTTATPSQTFFYWVRAENSSSVSSVSIPDQGTRTNTNQSGPLPPLGPPPPAPPGNVLTATKAYLGKTLFWDEQMSSTRTVSCGTCHHAGTGGVDPRSALTATNSTNPGGDGLLGTADDVRGSAGVPSNNVDGTYLFAQTYGLNAQVTGRRTVSYVNAGYAPLLFWDGRATGVFRDPITNSIILNGGAALESQAAGPPVSSAEMGHNGRDWNDVAARIAASRPLALSPSIPAALRTWISGRAYPDLFNEAFGTSEVTPARISMAIATYERTLYSDQTPLDRAVVNIAPLNAQQARGRNAFNAVSCNVCHAGPLFTDNTFRYIGVRPQNDDTGRFQQTGNNQDLGTFRVPSLRNVELRGSYFHNGQFTTLEQVVAFYNRGGDFNAPNKPTNLIRPLGLSGGQQADIVAFLRTLTDARVATETSIFDRPTLYMESNRVPLITGVGRAGSGGLVPQIKAISPPITGNPNFTVSMSSALGNANALLVISSVDPGVGVSIPTCVETLLACVETTTQNTGAGNGWASVSIRIPIGGFSQVRKFYARWYVSDPAAPNSFSVSQAAVFSIFGLTPSSISILVAEAD